METTQQRLFGVDEIPNKPDNHEWGTFKDSLKAPVHRWFTYPAGFSYKAVMSSLKEYGIRHGDEIYDPFMGTGTTNLVAKSQGINSIGIEAHPFVFKIADVKLNWDLDFKAVLASLETILDICLSKRNKLDKIKQEELDSEFPALVIKCYEPTTLYKLKILRDSILEIDVTEDVKNFLLVGLTSVLRLVSTAATGWPYIAPKKKKITSFSKNPIDEFRKQILLMVSDLKLIIKGAHLDYFRTNHTLINGDSRNTDKRINAESIDHIFTSPPYLNNFDYADRTRLELYFFGEAKTWGDISRYVRKKLITSATTQINRSDSKYSLSENLAADSPDVFNFLLGVIEQLGELRLTKGGKKSYDLLVAGYFNDMYQQLRDAYRVLKPGCKAIYVLGDSAPYGVHVPTDELIGKIGVAVGFSEYSISVLRKRGEKWAKNPQRHHVKLKESIVILSKD